MAEESKQRVHILRLFGMEQAALVRILREAAAQGCPGLRLLEQGGEQAVCVRARSQSPEDLDLAAQWADELEKLLSSACFGRDGLGLPQAAAQTLARKEFLVVAVDEHTGKLLGPVLASLPGGKAVYDFGSHSWGDAKKAARIAARTKGTGAESAARMGLEALRVSGADCALMAVPEQGENPAFALVVTPKVAWVRLMAKDDPAARNWLLDMARRMAAGLPPLPGTLHFTPGKTAPALPPRPPRPRKGSGRRPMLRPLRKTPSRAARRRSGFGPRCACTARKRKSCPPLTRPRKKATEGGLRCALQRCWCCARWRPALPGGGPTAGRGLPPRGTAP